MSTAGGPLAVVIPAKDEAARIAATVAAASAIPGVGQVVVVDDGSTDETAALAAAAGAGVVRHERNRGKSAAMTSGAVRVASGQQAGSSPPALLFLDADLETSAAAAGAIAAPVLAGELDMAIALIPVQSSPGGGRGRVVRLARAGIERATGWRASQPLSGNRCLSREAFAAARPLAPGWGVEVGLTVDLLRAGFRVGEVPCELHHRVTGSSGADRRHRAAQYRDVWLALLARRLRRSTGLPVRAVASRIARSVLGPK